MRPQREAVMSASTECNPRPLAYGPAQAASRPSSHDDLKPSTFVPLGEVVARLVRNQEQMRRERAHEG